MRSMFDALRRGALACAVFLPALAAAIPAQAATTAQSWNGWRWARTGDLRITLGNNVGAAWVPFLSTAATQWSAAQAIDFAVQPGRSSAGTCGAVFGTVQACSANYGATGWLGYATVWTTGTFITQATIKLNDYYFSMPKYNTDAWRSIAMCQEMGHTLGLDHADENRNNANVGSCMDYTNDPSGLRGTNGTLANVAPGANDFAALRTIYAKLDGFQLPTTKANGKAGSGIWIVDQAAVPEPRAWAMMLAGFGLAGAALRRRRDVPVTA